MESPPLRHLTCLVLPAGTVQPLYVFSVALIKSQLQKQNSGTRSRSLTHVSKVRSFATRYAGSGTVWNPRKESNPAHPALEVLAPQFSGGGINYA